MRAARVFAMFGSESRDDETFSLSALASVPANEKRITVLLGLCLISHLLIKDSDSFKEHTLSHNVCLK